MAEPSFRRHPSMPGMLRTMRTCLDHIPDPLDPSLSDRLISAPAVFLPGCRPCRGSTRWCGDGRILSGCGTCARGHLDARMAEARRGRHGVHHLDRDRGLAPDDALLDPSSTCHATGRSTRREM